jgi:hypothetical protein
MNPHTVAVRKEMQFKMTTFYCNIQRWIFEGDMMAAGGGVTSRPLSAPCRYQTLGYYPPRSATLYVCSYP